MHCQALGEAFVDAGIEDDTPFIKVTDNGVGLPKENRHRLAEPYMTTREKGTGEFPAHAIAYCLRAVQGQLKKPQKP